MWHVGIDLHLKSLVMAAVKDAGRHEWVTTGCASTGLGTNRRRASMHGFGGSIRPPEAFIATPWTPG